LPQSLLDEYVHGIGAMSVTINTNTSSSRIRLNLEKNSQELGTAFERLSSGLRINKASDDPALLALSSNLNFDSRVLAQASRNINDGISFFSIAEGALTQLSLITDRQGELAAQAANGSLSLTQRRALNAEANALVSEFNRIVEGTKFNGVTPLTYTGNIVGIQTGKGSDGSLNLIVGSELDRLQGTGSFTNSTTISGPNAIDLSSADLNNDGKVDLVYSLTAGGTSVAFGTGNGLFAAPSALGDSGTTNQIADVTGDGILDIVTSSATTMSIYRGTSSSTFTLSNSFSTTGGLITLADQNNDGKMDIIKTASAGSNAIVYLGNGNGTFRAGLTSQITDNVGVGALRLALGDFNGDGYLDSVHKAAAANDIVIKFGSSNGSFASGVTLSSSAINNGSLHGFSVGDFNLDGISDIVGASSGGIAYFQANGDGTFKSALTFSTANVFLQPTAIDINNDGLLDIHVSTTAFFGNGDGTFKSGTTTNNEVADAYTLNDFSGDGILDQFTVNGGGYLQLETQNTFSTTLMKYLNLTTQSSALNSISTINQTRQRISLELGLIGAHQSRLKTSLAVTQAQNVEIKSAENRISSADVAEETSRLTRITILQKTGAAILSQANLSPEIAIKLLKDI
jgi:flagellin